MKIEKIEMMRVKVDNAIYCDIIPNAEDEGVYDFWLISTECDAKVYMFGCEVASEDEALALVEGNVDEYLEELRNAEDDDDL